MSNLKLNKRMLALFLTATMIPSTLTACGKKAECDIAGNHAHKYVNEHGYVRYVNKEYLSYEGYDRSDEYIDIEGQVDLYNFIVKKDLHRIEDNLDVILESQENNQDYIEYRYKYIYYQPIPHYTKVGKVTSVYYTYIPQPRYSWTTDTSRMLTGETRICHYVYEAYKVEKDEKGKYVIIPSPQVEDLTTVMDEYPYIKPGYIKIVNIDGKEVDYEDGKLEDLTEEEKQRIEEHSEDEVKKLIKKNLE